jgi:predicted site-specific integrase-resolvase
MTTPNELGLIPAEDLIGPKEAAAIFGVAPLTASRWGRNGQVPTVQMPNGRRMFSRAYCETYMAKRRIEVEP